MHRLYGHLKTNDQAMARPIITKEGCLRLETMHSRAAEVYSRLKLQPYVRANSSRQHCCLQRKLTKHVYHHVHMVIA